MEFLARSVIVAALLFMPSTNVDLAQTTNDSNDSGAAEAKELFSSLAGTWSCEGAFSNGKPIASDLEFTLRLDGRALKYEHRDRPPNNFIATALWGPDTSNHQLVSTGFAGNATTLAPVLFTAKKWTAQSLTFEAQALTAPAFAPNRFTYNLEKSKLTITWEVQRNGDWLVGDRLECSRGPRPAS
jgi:hypothetical protein